MLGGSYTRNEDGSLTLVQRTVEPDEAKTAGTPAPADPPETKLAAKSAARKEN